MFEVYCVKCKKEMSPVIDKVTKELFCTECSEPLKDQNILTDFAKRQMLANGQVKRLEQSKKAFAVKCGACKKENPPKLVNGKILCSHCDSELTGLTKPYVQMLKQTLGSKSK